MKPWGIIFIFVFACTSLQAIAPEELEFFENRIRPVLAETCYECHNSVNKSRAGLALDWSEALLAGSDDGPVIVPGDPDASVLIWAIRHQDGFDMPEEGPKLEDNVIADFEAWVKMGAPDPRDKQPTQLDLDNAIAWETLLEKRSQWWSFQPLQKSPAPKTENEAWNQNEIDRFVYDSISTQGLEAQQEASPEVLVRRLHLILTGLPPKPEVTKAFIANPSMEAYEALVDELLSSQAYGERWGRHWLDWYRFSETHGSEGDPALPHASIYRDYIIRALNDDVPYNQLLIEHIAGDLLKRPRINKELELNESAIGPAHFRMVPYGFGVVDAYQEQIVNIDNQIDVLSKAMLGVTVSCARCHNHKFDPISQKDFYRLYGILVSTRPGTRNVDTKEKQALNKRSLQRLKPRIQKALADYWLDEVDGAVAKLSSFSFEESEQDLALFKDLKQARRKRKQTLPEDNDALDAFSLKLEMNQVGAFHPFAPMKFSEEVPRAWQQLILEHEAALSEFDDAKSNATFYADLRDQNTVDSWFLEGNGLNPKVSPAGSFAIAGEGHLAITGIYPRGVYSHLISDKHSGTFASPNHLAEGDWSSMRAVGRNGAIRMSARNYPLEQGLHAYEYAGNGAMQWFPLKKYKFWNNDLVHYQISTAGDKPVKHTSGRSWFGITEVIGGQIEMQELGTPLYTLIKDPESVQDEESLLEAYRDALSDSIKAWRRSRASDAQAQFLSTFARFNLLPNHVEELPAKLRSLIEEYRELENEIPEPTRAPAQLEGDVIDQPLLKRGEYKNADDPVSRQFLEVFANKTYSANNSGRLELAEDIAGTTNTLKTRVLVNRLWSYVFGQGIVATTDNFGRLGKKPTHPELLDYLALDFEKNDWSIKTSLKQMVMSRTFRSAGLAAAGVKEKDPGNAYYSFFSPRRLDAEVIKDSVNFLANEDYERSVYQKVIRNKLDPFLTTFNLPIPTTTISKRDSTNIPAQALSMMNGEFVQTASRQWAHRLIQATQGVSVAGKIDAFFWDAYGRSANEKEQEQLKDYFDSIDEFDTAMENIAFALMNTKEFMYLY
ncbi:PSD1 and planctomycete cytochrome C domain-containing protein [Opitutia bacterium ISCC 51]|nr:PSD1 and planctomycete cytochrome C domain-containing protein [Opitutae bacterium ISCC 51]QXD29281.1 PSD1 and planctomycete cytochrome C domain-containing protein [Opitutae bacterium ISCC 52]